ncbi:MAG: alpha/beta hydrolase [Flavobacteriales bacterium]|jgi:predicted esterase|nr:alpha/beta hydrolase [Flavobacteriales bacterium]|tara:strand:- start:2038 stop:2700 length:663 start_codon:yes stop_codon:yes gene_type:complete
MSKHLLEVTQKLRIVSLGKLNKNTTNIWLALHGYGQLVEYFKRHFVPLSQDTRAFLFPQGPHKFYLQGTEGRVGASWMTKEDRLIDIDNQHLFLNEVVSWGAIEAPKARFHMVGFSQGVATGMRFLGESKVHFHSLLAWAGSWPPDLDEKSKRVIAKTHMSAWFGSTDPFISQAKRQERIALYNNDFGLHPEVSTYDGAHTFRSDILAREINRLENTTLK